MNNLDLFFYPKSICVPGASSKEKSIGYELLRSIKEYGYTGKIFPVNPKADNILGYDCYSSIDDIKEKIDLAIIVVPKGFVEATVEQLLNKDVKSIILITAGFKETGKEGAETEKRIIEKIKNAGARMVGPNCMGIITTFNQIKLNATFVAEKPEIGNTGFLSQSGAIGAAVLNSLRETDIRFGHFISVGNKGDLSENDILDYWENDSNIKTISMYLESFNDGLSFIKKFSNQKRNKPVIILKGGRTSAGMKAASSHTGALGSSDRVVDSVLNQFGIIRVDDLKELFNTSKGFESFPLPKGKRVAVLTNAGGPAILVVDRIVKEGLELAELCADTKLKLKEFVHQEGSVENPVDLLPGGTSEQYKKANEVLLSDENVDAVISLFVEPVMVDAMEVIENVNSIRSDKPVYQVVMPLPEFWEKYRKNSTVKKPLFRNPEDPAEVISNILFFESRNKSVSRLSPSLSGKKSSLPKGYLDSKDCEELLKQYDIPAVSSLYVSADEAFDKYDIYYPVCLKGISSKVIHKSELNAVKLNIKSIDELQKAAGEISASFNKAGVSVEKFLIQPFIKGKYELLIGGFRDTNFGPMIMFGSGGKYVEVFNDTSIKSAYLSGQDIEEIIFSTKAGKILQGVRGENPADINKLKRIIASTAQLMLDNENIFELDLNPLIVTENGDFHVVDSRINIQ